MKFGIVGLGRMGANLSRHALEKGHQIVGRDPSVDGGHELVREGLELAESIEDLASKLPSPRIVFIYVPHGEPTEGVCQDLRPVLSHGDIVADGGNSDWRDSARR